MTTSIEHLLGRMRTGRRSTLSKIQRQLRKDKRITLDSYTNDWELPTSKIYLATSDVSDMIVSEFLFEKARSNQDIKFINIHLLTTHKEWQSFVDTNTKNRIRFYQSGEDTGTIYFKDAIVQFNSSGTYISVKLIGESKFIANFHQTLLDNFDTADSFIEWMYSADGSSVTVPLTTEKTPVSEMYPFLGDEHLHSYYDRYMDSSASVLVLIGPPGTGKTTFIRGLLQYTNSSAVVTYDPELLEKDYTFARFVEGNNNIMVIEDSDNFLRSREDGNTIMHKFLNIGDGLVTTKNKKLIFSTNLSSVKEIDPALVRPGRCFDVLTFDYLTKDQAITLAKALNIELQSVTDKYSIAEVFHKQNYKPKERKIGFI